MKLTFRVPRLDQMLEATLWTQEDGITPYWRDGLYQEYPEIDKEKVVALPEQERMKYVSDILTKIYGEKQDVFKILIQDWQKEWNSKLNEIESALSAAYEMDVKPVLNNMVAYVNLNPVCPRYLDTHSFYIFYKMEIDRVIRTCLHEIMHFLWFHKWQEHFHDNPKEYDAPHLKWIFSEMVQETMMADTPIRNLSKWQGNAYDYFYEMKIDGKPILQTLSDIHQAKGLIGLFEEGYQYCIAYENEIRSCIKKAES